MPKYRCKFFDAKGAPIKGGCHRIGSGCDFVHPNDPDWASAQTKGTLGGNSATWNSVSWTSESPVLIGANRSAAGKDSGWSSFNRKQGRHASSSSRGSGGGGGWGTEGSGVWGSGGGQGNEVSTGWGTAGSTGWGTEGSGGWGSGGGTERENAAASSNDAARGTSVEGDITGSRPTEARGSFGWGDNPGGNWGSGSASAWDGDESGWNSGEASSSGPWGVAAPDGFVPAADAVHAVSAPKGPQLKPAWDWGQETPNPPNPLPSVEVPVQGATEVPRPIAPSEPTVLIMPTTSNEVIQPTALIMPTPSIQATGPAAQLTPTTVAPINNAETIKTLLRAARVRQKRTEFSEQYDQWKASQRSKWFASVGKAAREQLDGHASELKKGRDNNDKLLSALIDHLAQNSENPHVADPAPILEETKHYVSRAKAWLESVRPHLPTMSPPPAGPDVAHTEHDEKSGDNKRVPSLKRRRQAVDDAPAGDCTLVHIARIEALGGRLDHLESEAAEHLSVDCTALVERTLAARRIVEDGEYRESAMAMDGPERRVDIRTKQDQLDNQLVDVRREKEDVTMKLQAVEADLASWKQRYSQSEANTTACLAELKRNVEKDEDQIAELTNKLGQLHNHKKLAPPAPSITKALIEDVYRVLRERTQDDMQSLSGFMKDMITERIRACDERLFTALSNRLEPTIKLTEAIYQFAETDMEKD